MSQPGGKSWTGPFHALEANHSAGAGVQVFFPKEAFCGVSDNDPLVCNAARLEIKVTDCKRQKRRLQCAEDPAPRAPDAQHTGHPPVLGALSNDITTLKAPEASHRPGPHRHLQRPPVHAVSGRRLSFRLSVGKVQEPCRRDTVVYSCLHRGFRHCIEGKGWGATLCVFAVFGGANRTPPGLACRISRVCKQPGDI